MLEKFVVIFPESAGKFGEGGSGRGQNRFGMFSIIL